MDEDGGAFDSRFDGDGPFRVTPGAGGVSLESALRDYGPAAIDDLIPRLRAIAGVLDAAHAGGAVHGALHPSKVIVHDTETSVVAGSSAVLPYAAPELADGSKPTPASDQFSFAAIAFEWMFGRPIDHPADRPVEVRTMPGVDRAALSKAFSRALAPNPRDRFASCAAFCDALANAVIPELPLLALEAEPESDDPIAPFMPEAASDPVDPVIEHVGADQADAGPVADTVEGVQAMALGEEEPAVAAASLAADRDEVAIDRDQDAGRDLVEPLATRSDERETPVASWNPPPPAAMSSQRFGGWALILATFVGAIFGFAAGYMARPRALQGGPAQEINVARGPETGVAPKEAVATPAPEAPRPAAAPKAAEPARAPEASAPAKSSGRLLVRSTPSGATVTVDGVAKGVTPLALRELPAGTLTVSVAHRGYIAESHKVVITASRPARTLDVRLEAEAMARPRPSTPATIGRAAAATGGLTIDSRPVGAAVTVNGKPSGNTPLSLNDLAPGEYRIVMAMPGYRNFATTVRVVAGERARAAASLTALEQQ